MFVDSLRSRVERFHDLVGHNNHVLQMMADAEEMLGGDYLFDGQYLNWLSAELAEHVQAVVHDLDVIAPGQHTALESALHRIRHRMTGVSDTRALVDDGPWCLDLARCGSEHVPLLGEKLARLAELGSRLGAPVPAGFVVTTATFHRLIQSSPSLQGLIAAADAPDADLADVSGALRARLADLPVPRPLARALRSALKPLGRHALLAVRSSASDEDGTLSFAGIHVSVMNVPRRRVVESYHQVLASLFSERALAYRRSHGRRLEGAAMAVGCMRMVSAVASGVLYSFDPNDPAPTRMLICGAWGHGATVMDGAGAVDRFLVDRRPPHAVVDAFIAHKAHQRQAAPEMGLQQVAVAPQRRDHPSVDEATLERLATLALAVERHMRGPQEIEWAVDEQGDAWILQARPLRVEPPPHERPAVSPHALDGHQVLLRGRGTVACRGVGAGPVVVVSSAGAPHEMPAGSVLVTRYATPELSRLLPSACALIADAGSPAGHLAALARELRIPALVAAEVASQVLEPGMVVTVDAEESTVYAGRVEALLQHALWQGDPYDDTREFRALRDLLKLVTPLTLLDPAARGFKAERCQTYHDIIRFAHEKAVAALTDVGTFEVRKARRILRSVGLSIPLGLSLLDLGGAVAAEAGAPPGEVLLDQITCAPLAMLLSALMAPGVWDTRPAGMDLRTLVSTATRAPSEGGLQVRRNLAIGTDNYLHLSLFLGYHYNDVDCYLGDTAEDSYLLFRFVGGASDLARRVRRVDMLREILSHYGFVVEATGDLLLARMNGVSPSTVKRLLWMTGRLIGFTRQLDVVLRDAEITRAKVAEFLTATDDALSLRHGPVRSPAKAGEASPLDGSKHC